MADSSPCEANLVERAILGDADAFGELYLIYLDAIYRYIYFRVEDADSAEDLTEQVFLKAWVALPGYRQRGNSFSGWLYRIAHNAVVDHHRARARHRRQLGPVPLQGKDSSSIKEPNVLDRVIKGEEAAALAAAIVQLTEEQQQVILLRFIEGLSHAQVARIIDKSEGACRVIQHRALAALNQLLAEEQHA